MSVASSYAKALYESAKAQNAPVDQIETQLEGLVRAIDSSKEARSFLFGPVATVKEKQAFLEELGKRMSLAPLLSQFVALLARKGRMSIVGEIREAFTAARLLAEGGVSGKLVSAEPVQQSDVDGLSQAFSKKLGKKVAFRVSTDPSLLAGMKVTVAGVTYDGTLKAQLQRLKDQIAHVGDTA